MLLRLVHKPPTWSPELRDPDLQIYIRMPKKSAGLRQWHAPENFDIFVGWAAPWASARGFWLPILLAGGSVDLSGLHINARGSKEAWIRDHFNATPKLVSINHKGETSKWHDMTRNDTGWHGMTRNDTAWHETTRHVWLLFAEIWICLSKLWLLGARVISCHSVSGEW